MDSLVKVGASVGTRGKIQISKMTVSSLPFSSKILLYLVLICELILKDKSDISNSLKIYTKEI